MSREKSILIACPAGPGTRLGNRITAIRWQAIFRRLGFQTRIADEFSGDFDILVALHAYHSSDMIAKSKRTFPDRFVIVAITGTDLYLHGNDTATQNALRLADDIVVLQSTAKSTLPPRLRSKAHVIYQSAEPTNLTRPTQPRALRVIVAGHLRIVKDPFRAAMAVRSLPLDSKILVQHFGGVLDAGMKRIADDEMYRNPRYQYLGEIPRGKLRRRLATSWLMVLSSKMEGGANVLSEAIVNHCPVLASRIDGSVGLLGADYAGYFEFGKTRQLRDLLLRCEQDPLFYRRIQKQVEKRATLFKPAAELAAWRTLLANLGGAH